MFLPEKHADFQAAMDITKGVQISDVTFATSRIDPDSNDVRVSRQSSMCYLSRRLPFDKKDAMDEILSIVDARKLRSKQTVSFNLRGGCSRHFV